MFILIEKDSNIIYTIADSIVEKDGLILDEDTNSLYDPTYYTFLEVGEVPKYVRTMDYCYTPEKGYYLFMTIAQKKTIRENQLAILRTKTDTINKLIADENVNSDAITDIQEALCEMYETLIASI